MEEIRIYQKKSKQIKLFFLGLIMLLMCILCVMAGSLNHNYRSILIGIFGIIFFGLCFVFIVYRLIKPVVILTINNTGIIDRSSLTAVGMISWENIEDFYITSVKGNRFICVKLRDNEKILSGLPGWKAKLLRLNIGLGYEPIQITLQSAKADINEVLNILLTRLHTRITLNFNEEVDD